MITFQVPIVYIYIAYVCLYDILFYSRCRIFINRSSFFLIYNTCVINRICVNNKLFLYKYTIIKKIFDNCCIGRNTWYIHHSCTANITDVSNMSFERVLILNLRIRSISIRIDSLITNNRYGSPVWLG